MQCRQGRMDLRISLLKSIFKRLKTRGLMKQIPYSNLRMSSVRFIPGMVFLFLIVFSCKKPGEAKKEENDSGGTLNEIHKKPVSTFQDTFVVNEVSAVFYEPDSIQLLKIKELTQPRIYESSMHEYFYQRRNAHLTLKQNWPQVKIVDTQKVRYLQFIKNNKTKVLIDLNDYGDAYGMFLFDTRQDPVPADMANLDEALVYFQNK